MNVEKLLFWIGAVSATIAFITLLHKTFLRPVYRKIKWHENFRKLWDGEPANNFRGEIPGVIKRLNRIDGELKSNGGSTMKDIVNKNHADIQTILESLGNITTTIERMENRQIVLMRDVEKEIHQRQSEREKTEWNTSVLWEAVEELGSNLPNQLRYGDEDGRD